MGTIIDNGIAVTTFRPSGGGSGASDYQALSNKPKINGIELLGDKGAEQLGLAGSDSKYHIFQTFAEWREAAVEYAPDEISYIVDEDVIKYGNPAPATNEIWYTSVDDAEVTGWDGATGLEIISNVKDGDHWVVKLSGDVEHFNGTYIMYWYQSRLSGNVQTVILPSSVKSIGIGAFNFAASQERNLTNVKLPEGLEEINYRVFEGSPINELIIPDTVTYINGNAFYGVFLSSENFVCPESLDPAGNNYWGAVIYDYQTDDTLFVKDGVVVGVGDKTRENYTIPSDVTEIGVSAFSGCDQLVSMEIPDGVTAIGDDAFSGCSSLQQITFSGAVTSLGAAFGSCASLVSISLPSGITTVASNTFYDCENLESVVIPEGVTTIEEEAFYNCGKLVSISFPESLINAEIPYPLPDSLPADADNCQYFGDSVTGVYYFAGITDRNTRTSLEIKEGTRWIANVGGWRMDSGNWPLKDIVLPSTTLMLAGTTFQNCHFETMTIKAVVPPAHPTGYTWDADVIYVPAQSVEAYKTAERWSYLADKIQAIVE